MTMSLLSQRVVSALFLLFASSCSSLLLVPPKTSGSFRAATTQQGKRPHHTHLQVSTDPISSLSTTPTQDLVTSVNYFISRQCNYSCKFCFHTQKNTNRLELADAQKGLRLLRDAGTKKINFAGGEPFLHDLMLGELCRYASESLGMAVSIISNGSLIRPYWMKLYGEYVDVLGISVDSFDANTNAAIGRGDANRNQHVDRMLRVRDLCQAHDIIFKLNTVVCRLNWEEDLSDHIRNLDPYRWKVFQVLLLGNENSGRPGELRDATDLTVTDQQFWSFVHRHDTIECLVPEPNNLMQNSYLLLDEHMRFLDCSSGAKIPTSSILDVGVEAALQQAGFDHRAFHERGGIYDWSRDK